MILCELTGGNEQNPTYQALAISNGDRVYRFLESVVTAAVAVNRPLLSETVVKAFNYHAISCLHTNAGDYRPCEVTVGIHRPPEHYRVAALMEDFVNTVNRSWVETDPIPLVAYVLWRLCHIHPFINGNGRTARAACYFVLCAKCGGSLPGTPTLPELLVRDRDEYVVALQNIDASILSGVPDFAPLHALLTRLVIEQAQSANPPAPAAPLQIAPPQP